ncbi:uncharacterized protein TNCV_1617921 [Trichonephila clavipes]|nr:uncharacterized protein TNCV_1617921 [Trichonephila clavipes]
MLIIRKLEEISNTSELCSEIDEENFDREDSIYDLLDSKQFDTENEEHNIVNKRRGRKSSRLFSNSEDDCKEKESNQKIKSLIDGSV